MSDFNQFLNSINSKYKREDNTSSLSKKLSETQDKNLELTKQNSRSISQPYDYTTNIQNDFGS